jgi:hypothetical protein
MRAAFIITVVVCFGAALARAQTPEPAAVPAPGAGEPAQPPAPSEPAPPPSGEPTPPSEGADTAGAGDAAQTMTAADMVDAPPAAATTNAPASATAAATATTTTAPKARSAPQIGITPGTAQTGTLDLSAPPEATLSTTPAVGEWKFDFHGFLRAPLRLGLGNGDKAAPAAGQGSKWHSPPQVPDGTFTDWRYTNNSPGPWAELRFSYGNTRVTGNVLIAAYNQTDGGYRNLQSQLGINQAFITLNEADLLNEKGGLIWNVGVFQNRYGGAGRYDAGKYETYLFGRTHVAGETLTGFYNLTPSWTVTIEHGVGAKLEAPPANTGVPDAAVYLPYGGPVQQGTQLVHHAHIALSHEDMVQLGAHYLTTWTDDARLATDVDGRITVAGADLRLTASRFGDGYVGYSHLSSRTPLRVGEGLEMLHSISGWNLRDNFFGPSANGSGAIDTVLWQYTFSFARFLRHPEPFWGQGPDVVLAFFGMYNHVASDDKNFSLASNKLKYGGDATYTPLGFLGIGVRVDEVEPDLDNSTLSFWQLSPKIILRSEFVGHEQFVLQYTHYFNNKNVTPAWPAGSLPADKNAFMISAIMWW